MGATALPLKSTFRFNHMEKDWHPSTKEIMSELNMKFLILGSSISEKAFLVSCS